MSNIKGQMSKVNLKNRGYRQGRRDRGGVWVGTPLLRWKILRAIYSHFGEILDDLSPILVIISNGFSFILEQFLMNFRQFHMEFLMNFLLSRRQPLVNFHEFKRQFPMSSLASWKQLLMNFRQFQRCF